MPGWQTCWQTSFMICKPLERKDSGKVTTPKSANCHVCEGGGENGIFTTPGQMAGGTALKRSFEDVRPRRSRIGPSGTFSDQHGPRRSSRVVRRLHG